MNKQHKRAKLPVWLLGLIAFALFCNTVAATGVEPQTKPDTTAKTRLVESYGKLPLSFEANRGQTDKKVQFISRGQGYGLFLTPTEAVLSLHKSEPTETKTSKSSGRVLPVPAGKTHEKAVQSSPDKATTLHMKLVGSNPNPHIQGLDELPGRVNYFRGKDPKQWQTNIPTYAKTKYEKVYPGIDLIYYGNQRQLEYDFIVAPGADPKAVRLSFEGAEKVAVDAQGDLVLQTVGGDVRLHKPVAYQTVAGQRRTVDARFVLHDASNPGGKNNQSQDIIKIPQIGFQLAAYETAQTLVIDPVLAYSSYLGGGNDEKGKGIAVDSAGNVYVTGSTSSANFPVVNARYPTGGGYYGDAFVTKFNASGTQVLYSTFLGGNAFDEGTGIAVDSAGNAYVIGSTQSSNFPAINARYSNFRGGSNDAFVTKFNVSGAQVLYSTYLGGNDVDFGSGIAVDSAGNAYVTGFTLSSDFPAINAKYPNLLGGEDAFVTKFNSSGTQVLYSTYLGGSNYDFGNGIAVDSAGNAYVTGITGSSNFPAVKAKYPNLLGVGDAFVTKFNASGAQVLYSTYLGGNDVDFGSGIAIDSAWNAYVTGFTQSSDFPAINAKYPNLLGGEDAFVTKFNSSGTQVLYSTYLGGSNSDYGNGIAVDSAGNAYVTGFTQSSDFPAINAKYPNLLGGEDAFVTKFNSSGTQVLYSTYLGGSNSDYGNGIAVDSAGNAYVTGFTQSSDFPAINAKYPNLLGGEDAFVTKFNSSGTQVLYSTYLGGSNYDYGNGIAVDSADNAYVTGGTFSSDFPTHANDPSIVSYDPDIRGLSDAFVAKITDSKPLSQPAVSISPSSLPFNNVTLGIPKDLNFTVTNTGGSTLTGSAKTSAPFAIVSGGSFSLAARASQTVTVRFSPNAAGTFNGNVSFTTNVGNSSRMVSGTGHVQAPTVNLGGNSPTNQSGMSAEPVNTATGNYYYQHTDLALPGRGLPLVFTRTLNVQDSSSGPFGPGWTHSYNLKLSKSSNGSVVIKMADGHEEFYDSTASGAYQAHDPGVFNTLVKNGDGSFVLIQKKRTRMAFTGAGRLSEISGRNGNRLSFAYNSAGTISTITDTVGRIVTLSYDAKHHLTTLTDPAGRKVQYRYDANGRLISDTDPKGGVMQYHYTAAGLLDVITDRRRHTLIANTYDSSKRVVSQLNGKGGKTRFTYNTPKPGTTRLTDPLGHVTMHTHDVLRRLIAETDALGHKTQYVYDAHNNRTQIIDKNGRKTAFTYDSQGNVLTRTDAKKGVTTLKYNALNDPVRIVDALGQATTFAYDAKGNLNGVTDALGHQSKVTYDASGQPVSVTDARGFVTLNTFDKHGNLIQIKDPLGHKTTFTYDAISRRTGMTDANGHRTRFAYDYNGNLLSVTDALSHTTRFTYDANNNRTGVTDPRRYLTTFVYDANDLLSKATDPLGNFVQYAYDAADNRTKVADPRGKITKYAYDAANRLTQVTDALNHSTRLAYDANGNLLAQANPLGHVSRFAYDELNRLLNATDALGNKGFRSYDASGRLIQVKDAKGRITKYVYNALGQLRKVTDAKGGTVIYYYDATGNRIAVTDPKGNTTRYNYDALNRLIRKTDPLGQAYSYSYDPAGNRVSLTDAKGQKLRYRYDGKNRLAAIVYPDNTQVSFGYDASGNRTRMIDKLGASTYAFDPLNRLEDYTDAFGKTVSNEYDKAGNRTSLIYPDGKRVTYAYDALNRMASVTDWLNGVTDYRYDAASNLTEALNPNDTKARYGYDAAERLVKLANAKADTSVLASYALTLDAVGNRTGINRNEPLAPLFTQKTQALTFDKDNRLLTLNAAKVTHDRNGNLTAEPGKSFKYDFEDRLVAASGSQTAQFGYDGVGNRLVAKRNGQITRYTLDVSGAMSNVLAENDSTGKPTAYYVHGLGLISRITPSGNARYYHYDTIGSTVALTDAAGKVTDSYAYDPFGQVLNAQGTSNNPFRYVGQFGVMQEGNGLQFMRARYYEAGVGRFLNKDPLLGTNYNAQSQNRYSYALNSPNFYADYSGLTAKELTAKLSVNLGSSYLKKWTTGYYEAGALELAAKLFVNLGSSYLEEWTTDYYEAEALKTALSFAANQDPAGAIIYMKALDAVKIGVPIISSATSMGIALYNNQDKDPYEQASKAVYAGSVSLGASAATLACGTLCGLAVTMAADYVLDPVVEKAGDWSGDKLYNLGHGNWLGNALGF